MNASLAHRVFLVSSLLAVFVVGAVVMASARMRNLGGWETVDAFEEEYFGGLSRTPPVPAWPARDVSNLCTEIFIKIYKCGSSTNAGVARAIGAHRNLTGTRDLDSSSEYGPTCKVPTAVRRKRLEIRGPAVPVEEEGCKVHANHGMARSLAACRFENTTHDNASYVKQQVRQNSMLWTFIRDPGTRAVSHCLQKYFAMNHPPNLTDAYIIDFASHVPGSYIFNYMDGISLNPYKCEAFESAVGEPPTEAIGAGKVVRGRRKWDDDRLACEVERLLDSYDFVGLVEREDESLIAMKFLFSLKFRDILHMSAKIRSDNPKSAGRLHEPGPDLQRYMAEDFYEKSRVDRALHAGANARLDSTIARYGDAFHDELERFETMMVEAIQFCGFPITTQEFNRNRDCYWKDNGCGFKCLDEFAARFESYD